MGEEGGKGSGEREQVQLEKKWEGAEEGGKKGGPRTRKAGKVE